MRIWEVGGGGDEVDTVRVCEVWRDAFKLKRHWRRIKRGFCIQDNIFREINVFLPLLCNLTSSNGVFPTFLIFFFFFF